MNRIRCGEMVILSEKDEDWIDNLYGTDIRNYRGVQCTLDIDHQDFHCGYIITQCTGTENGDEQEVTWWASWRPLRRTYAIFSSTRCPYEDGDVLCWSIAGHRGNHVTW